MRVGISSEKKGCETGERGGVRVRREGVRIGREREGCETGACKGGKMGGSEGWKERSYVQLITDILYKIIQDNEGFHFQFHI